MSNRKTTRAHVRTAAALKADAGLLSGDRSRIALAAVDDTAQQTETGTIGELWLYGLVGGFWRGFDAESVSNALRQLDVDTLYVRVHSPGGRASDGVAISNLLRNHRAKIVIVVDGIAASAASVIAIAGDEIVMCPGSQMMLHDASLWTGGNAGQLRRDADWLDGQSNNYAGVYAHKAGGTPESWRQVMLANDGEGTWYTAAEAVAAGLADEVGTRVADGSPPVAPVDDIDESDAELLARIEHDLLILEREVHASVRAAWQGQPARPSTAHQKPPTASAGGSVTTTQGGSAMSFTDQQLTTMRDKLELPADADEAAIVAAVTAVVEDSLEERPAQAGVAEGHVVIPAAELATLRAGAQTAANVSATLHERDREAFLDANRTKYPKELRAAWAKQYDLDPAAAVKAMADAPVLIPTAELGHEDPDATEADASGSDAVAVIRDSDAYKNWEM